MKEENLTESKVENKILETDEKKYDEKHDNMSFRLLNNLIEFTKMRGGN